MSAAGNASKFTLFISDLHLCTSRPAITDLFIEFLQTTAAKAEALYILGDLFEYWAGDDDLNDPHHSDIIAALKTLASSKTRIFFMHGNRDFLLGTSFAETAGITLLTDPTLLNLYSKRVLLSHGDALCTDDRAYQEFRSQVRSPAWQQAFLNQSLVERKAQIEVLRARSEQEKSHKTMRIMDVNAEAVRNLMRAYNYPELLIHGHTHRPALHNLEFDAHRSQCWVLGDWYEQGSCLRMDSSGCTNVAISME